MARERSIDIITELPGGYLGKTGDNEIVIVSTMQDPGKYRLAVEQGKVESNLGAVSFDVLRPDGILEEYAYVMGRLTADKQGGACYLAVRPSGGDQCKEVFYIDSTAAVFQVPIIAPNIGGGGAAGERLVSADGRLQLICQSDQPEPNFVLYKDGIPIRALFGLPLSQVW